MTDPRNNQPALTDRDPSDQYEQAAAMAAALELQAALTELRNATLPGAPQDPIWLAAAHRRANAVLAASDLDNLLSQKASQHASTSQGDQEEQVSHDNDVAPRMRA